MELNYKIHENENLFNDLVNSDMTDFASIQSYVPIYERFFVLNHENYNKINLNHVNYIKEIKEKVNNNIFHCTIDSLKQPNQNKAKKVFFKFSPLLDPIKYVTGKYDDYPSEIIHLPTFTKRNKPTHFKIKDVNNSAYVDSFFTYLTSQLQHNHGFSHGLDFYGSFLGIKNNHLQDITDDYEYLEESSYFYKNQGIKFKLEGGNGVDIVSNSSRTNKPQLNMSDDSVNDIEISNLDELSEIHSIFDSSQENILEFTKNNLELLYHDKDNFSKTNSNASSLKSECSSRSSNTDNGSTHGSESDGDSDCESDGEDKNSKDSESDISSIEEDPVFVKINKFPVQLIALECCEKTLDSLILDKILSDKEWGSIVIQILMTLITYQKAFKLTHNDLHSNNVMYIPTDKKHIYYTYKKKNYKVPTFGRLFKIIDYGRAIYKYKKKTICSDSFHKEGDASTQYNCEPYLDENKPRLEPNFSFDLCRLGCSIFDYLIEDLKEVNELDDNPIIKIITDWCKDDKGRNIMYKVNGQERYPEFKLYKMIARTVHNHTPDKVLENVFFDRYLTGKIKKKEAVMNIDKIPEYHNE